MHVYGSVTFPKTLDADVLVLAGDIHGLDYIRSSIKEYLETHYGIPVIIVRGNHDYWDGPFDDSGLKIYHVGGLKIGACTFWTDLVKDPFAYQKSRGFSDFLYINGMTLGQWQNRHELDIEALKATRPDIVITHHAPSFGSVSEQFYGDSHNTFFVSDHDKLILELQPKIWIHGHVHSHWDYMIGNTRVLCNPLGYPNEIKYPVDVKIVEV